LQCPPRLQLRYPLPQQPDLDPQGLGLAGHAAQDRQRETLEPAGQDEHVGRGEKVRNIPAPAEHAEPRAEPPVPRNGLGPSPQGTVAGEPESGSPQSASGGDRGSGYYASKEVLYRQLDDSNEDPQLDALENRLTDEANQLGVGPMGFGGKTTVLGTKITHLNRLPASYFVSVSYMCWAYRRRKMVVQGDQVQYS